MTTIANIEDRSLSRLVGDLLLFRAFSFSCFEFVSDLDIRISCFHPTIMQNKPNSPNPKMDLTSYGHRDYEHEAPLRTPPNQTQYYSTLEIRPQRIHAGPSANLRHRRNKINQTCFRFFKIPQKSPKTTRFSKFFSFFLTFSRVFHTQSARLCPPFYPKNPIPSPKINPNANFPHPISPIKDGYCQLFSIKINSPTIQPEPQQHSPPPPQLPHSTLLQTCTAPAESPKTASQPQFPREPSQRRTAGTAYASTTPLNPTAQAQKPSPPRAQPQSTSHQPPKVPQGPS